MGVQLTVAVEAFPIEGRFVIARGAKTQALVVTATLRAGGAVGRGECVPYARYGESADSVVAEMERARVHIEAGADRAALQGLLPAGAARNALDCAMWDLEAKTSGRRGASRRRLRRARALDHRLHPLGRNARRRCERRRRAPRIGLC